MGILQNRADAVSMLISMYESAPFVGVNSRRRIGQEDEIPIVTDRGEIGDALRVIRLIGELPGWTKKYEGDLLCAVCHPTYGEITTDAGLGTIELVGNPTDNLHVLYHVREEVLTLIARIAHDIGQYAMGIGRIPFSSGSLNDWVQKERYKALVRAVDHPGIHQATVCCSQQSTVDARTAAELMRATVLFQAVTALFEAFFANSPWLAGEIRTDRLSSRQLFWQDFAPDRVGVPHEPQHTTADLASWMVDKRLLFHPDGMGGYKITQNPFWQGVAGMELGSDGLRSTTLFHEGCLWLDSRARLNYGAVEVRPACQQPRSAGISLSALVLGLMENLDELWGLVFDSGVTWENWRQARTAAAYHGMEAFVGDMEITHFMRKALDLARDGLLSLGQGEDIYLAELWRRLSMAELPAHKQISVFHDSGLSGLFAEFDLARVSEVSA